MSNLNDDDFEKAMNDLYNVLLCIALLDLGRDVLLKALKKEKSNDNTESLDGVPLEGGVDDELE